MIFDIAVAESIFTAITTIFIIILTFLALKFQAKPKVKIRFKNGGRRIKFHVGEKATLRLHAENVGHWYSAKPAATNVILWVNFEPAFEPIEIRYGAALETRSHNVRYSKHGNKWLRASEIHLFHQEAGEDFEVDVKMPEKEGLYKLWIPIHSDQGDSGFQKLWIKVVKGDSD
jgi:hypothetical protein